MLATVAMAGSRFQQSDFLKCFPFEEIVCICSDFSFLPTLVVIHLELHVIESYIDTWVTADARMVIVIMGIMI